MKPTQTFLRLLFPPASVWFLSFALPQASALPATDAPATRAHLNETYGKLPLNFEANQGQSDERVKFISRGGGYTLFLTSNEAVLRVRNTERGKPAVKEGNNTQLQTHSASHPAENGSVLRMRFAGGNDRAEVTGEEELAGRSNYFIGNDPDRWLANLPNYRKVRIRNVYPGIDVLYYGHGRQLEYDLVVAPGADLNAISLEFEGARKLRFDRQGNLLLRTYGGGDLLMGHPIIYQEVDGQMIPARGSFVSLGKKRVGFRVKQYDRSKALVIDPALTLAYSTLLGGSNGDVGLSIAVDSAGNAYVTGFTYSTNFPLNNAFQSTMSGTSTEAFDAFVSKLSADGSSLIYSTYLGGSDNNEKGIGIAVDSAGNAYVMGLTNSHNFPTTANALQPASGQSNASQFFVSKLSPSGSSLLYSTYLGTTLSLYRDGVLGGIAVDGFGNAYVTGTTDSPSFPLKNAFQSAFNGGGAAIITKLDTTASGADSLIYSSYLGAASGLPSVAGSEGHSVAVDANGNAYIAGTTSDANFPTRNAFQPAISPPGSGQRQTLDAFLTKINTKASGNASLVYSTFLGGNDHEREAYVAADEAGNAYLTGETFSTNFPTKNPFQPTNMSANSSAFVAKLDTTASGANSLVYSTYLGGSGSNSANSIAVDSNGDVYIAGTGDIPQVNPLPVDPADRFSFLAKLNNGGSDLIYSTSFWGGIKDLALDSAKNVYLTGITIEGTNLPTTPGAFQTQPGGSNDAFISKLSFTEATGLTVSSITPNKGGDGGSVTAVIKGTNFVPGATVKLIMAGQPDLVAEQSVIRDDGRAIAARFDLLDAPRGAWDVVITNPGNASATLPGGFNVEAGRAPELYTEIIGRDGVRPNQEQIYTIVCGNSGNVDAYVVPVTIFFPTFMTFKPAFKTIPPPQPPGMTIDYSQYPITAQDGNMTALPLYIPSVPAGGTRIINIKLTAPNDPSLFGKPFSIRSTAGHPFVTESATSAIRANSARSVRVATKGVFNVSNDCLQDIVSAAFDCTLVAFPGLSCANNIRAFAGQTIINLAVYGSNLSNDQGDIGSTYQGIALSLAGAVFSCIPPIGTYVQILQCGYDFLKIANDCPEITKLFRFANKSVQIIRSLDPNDKAGPEGFGAPRYISGAEPLSYAVFYENEETASAPAQVVIVTDQLDPTKFYLETFSLGSIDIGAMQVTPAPFSSEFNTDVDLRPANNLIARITAGLDKNTGLITWKFTSIDPATGQPTTDPSAGFLPPNRTSPEGQGRVLFTVSLKNNLPTNTQLNNSARVVFDQNPPIDTPVWTNTIDNTNPTSSVTALPATATGNTFQVRWSGSDAGSGVVSYTVFVSENGGPYTVFISDTASTSAYFTGKPGTSYSFYTVAHDGAGNLEPAATVADATTTTPTNTVSSLGNISTRLAVQTGDNVLIAGFIITGSSKNIIVRAIGPSLAAAGITNFLADPTLELHDGSGALLVSNDNWTDTQRQDIKNTTLPPTNFREAAITRNLSPGSYTVIVRGQGDTTGIGLVEVYDLDGANSSQLANISSRGVVQTGDDVMIGGFIVSGSNSKKVIVRAIGPELTNYGVAGALQDTTLELFDANGMIASNDDWRSTQEQEIIATTLQPNDNRESAIVATLPPGGYTAIVRGKGNTTGVALVEVYTLN